MFVNVLLHSLLVTLGYGDVVVAEDYAQAVYYVGLWHVDDEGTVYAHKLWLWKIVFQRFHVHQAQHLFLRRAEVYLHVVFQSFDVEYVVKEDTNQLILALYVYEAVLRLCGCACCFLLQLVCL